MLGVIALVVGAIVWGVGYYFLHSYAEDAAKPIEAALIKAGAVKVCTSGDPGRGPDNLSPNYTARFQFSVGRDEAIAILKKAANEHGFTNLVETRNESGTIDAFSDRTSQKSTYKGFDTGNINVGLDAYSNTRKDGLGCAMENISLVGDATHTAVSLSVSLPSSR